MRYDAHSWLSSCYGFAILASDSAREGVRKSVRFTRDESAVQLSLAFGICFLGADFDRLGA